MTVRELIAALSTCDLNKQVVIDDADTGWWLELKTVFDNDRDGVVEIGGNHGDVVDYIGVRRK